jgi:hypothetical protein
MIDEQLSIALCELLDRAARNLKNAANDKMSEGVRRNCHEAARVQIAQAWCLTEEARLRNGMWPINGKKKSAAPQQPELLQ